MEYGILKRLLVLIATFQFFTPTQYKMAAFTNAGKTTTMDYNNNTDASDSVMNSGLLQPDYTWPSQLQNLVLSAKQCVLVIKISGFKCNYSD